MRLWKRGLDLIKGNLRQRKCLVASSHRLRHGFKRRMHNHVPKVFVKIPLAYPLRIMPQLRMLGIIKPNHKLRRSGLTLYFIVEAAQLDREKSR